MSYVLKNAFKLSILFSLFILTSSILFAVDKVDSTFRAFPSQDVVDNSANTYASITIQPDGKILVSGSFRVVNGVAVNNLIRLNTDGSLDTSFNCEDCNEIVGITTLLQPDGKIIVAGTRGGEYSRSKLIRINSDGSLDPTFSSPLIDSNSIGYYGAVVFSQQADGKIFIGHSLSFQGSSNLLTYRLNTDGSFDNSFTSFLTNTRLGRGSVNGIKQLPNGKLYVYGATSFGAFAKLNADGTEDTAYEKPSFTSDVFQSPPSVTDIVVQSDGKVVMVGSFSSINGFTKRNLTRINQDGGLDVKFNNSGEFYVEPLDEYQDGKLLVRKRTDIAGLYFPEKLTADGNVDSAFNFPSNLVSVNTFTLDKSTNKIYVFARFSEGGKIVFKIARLNADGSLDSTFNNKIGNAAIINGLAVQPDQKILMVGKFDYINTTPISTIARVNTDGTVDGTFNSGTGFNTPPTDAFVSGDGKIYIVGTFTSYNGIAVSKLARLNSDGTLDTGFSITVNNSVSTITFQSDGKLLIGGSFTTLNGLSVKGVARLNSDGTTDASFNPVIGTTSVINSIFVQSDGKIMIGGVFTGAGGFNRNNLARFNSDGSYDSSFNAGNISGVKQVVRISNGQYFAAALEIVKLNADGTKDVSFDSPEFGNTSSSSSSVKFLVLPDNGLLVGGSYNLVDNLSFQGVVRLLPNGNWATLSYPNGTNGPVYDIEAQSDGKVVVGGDFSLIEKSPRPGIARLNADQARQIVNYDFDGDGKADIAVFRPSENKWYILRSSDFGVTQQVFAITGDSPVASDFDGDGKTDLAIFRNSLGDWWSQSTISGGQVFLHLGADGDIPRPSDFDGDGRSDYIVYRPTNFMWYRVSSSTGQASQKQFGAAGDKPVIGDFDGDGRTDIAIYRPLTGDWWWQSDTDNIQRAVHWGISTDIPSPGDYDGDGKTDYAVYRPSTGVWYILNSGTGLMTNTIVQFGLSGDKPVPADYDGDGRTDIAVYRPSTGVWYLWQSTNGFAAYQFGISTDIPVQNALIP